MMLRRSLLAIAVTTALVGCGKSPADAPGTAQAAKAKAGAQTLLIAPEDMSKLGQSDYASGPVVIGSVQPERRADLRAEVSSVVLQVLKENGEAVRRGDLLVRLDDQAIRDSLASAEESARASGQSFEQAERQFQRLKTLQAQGMSSVQAMEDAEVRRNNAQSDLVAARARVATARQQLQRTEVRAPFDGVVSERKVSSGDTAQTGKELVKVIDPGSMRFEGLVSADRMHELKVGQPVNFRVNGYAQTDFSGKIRRVDAAANATTRQVEVLVAFDSAKEAPRVAGLYAEGRIASASRKVLMIAEGAIQRAGDKAYVWRIQDKTLRKVEVALGERDDRRGEFVVKSGLNDGDVLLRSPTSTLVDGQTVEFAASASAASAATKG